MDELSKYGHRIEYHEKGHRCSICNSVNIGDIETDLGDFHENMSFTEDPSNNMHFICVECAEAIQELRFDYLLQDTEDDS